ncbi:hypothetical protein A6R68_08473 [Neotoma lepida]|uniref:Uncharacterized protein n=1 Tax=Neotoma lepida TaxID=56216 RepID=A0A1A6G3H7_NEOLE|nr:hypothetical protein A6R68_08473 [Neotoma lepida]
MTDCSRKTARQRPETSQEQGKDNDLRVGIPDTPDVAQDKNAHLERKLGNIWGRDQGPEEKMDRGCIPMPIDKRGSNASTQKGPSPTSPRLLQQTT